MQIVVMARYALALLAKFAAPLVPSTQTVGDDDLVPERARRFDGRNVRNCEIEVGVVGDIGPDERRLMGIERRLGAHFDADRFANISILARVDAWIPDL